MRQIFLDTETTGLNPDQGDRIVEVGCIEYLNRRPTGRTLHHYVNPQRPCHPDAVRVHGITDDFLADKPLFAHMADELQAFVEGAELVIHNAPFDLGFLDAEFTRLGRGPFRSRVRVVIDSLQLARDRYPGKANSLDALCKRLEVDNSGRDLHGALLDAGLLAEVYLRLTRGQRSLVIDDAQAAGGAAQAAAADLSQFHLTVLDPSAEEEAAHAALMADLHKASGGRTVWPVQAQPA